MTERSTKTAVELFVLGASKVVPAGHQRHSYSYRCEIASSNNVINVALLLAEIACYRARARPVEGTRNITLQRKTAFSKERLFRIFKVLV